MTADSEFGGMIYGIFLFSFISSNNKIINLTSYEIWEVKRWRVNSCFGFVGFQNFIFVFWNFLKKLIWQNYFQLSTTSWSQEETAQCLRAVREKQLRQGEKFTSQGAIQEDCRDVEEAEEVKDTMCMSI
jgi:hypothetical protein